MKSARSSVALRRVRSKSRLNFPFVLVMISREDDDQKKLIVLSDSIPAAFIITGPNITSQELLFDQLAESLADSTPAKVVSVRSAEAPNLKAALKKIIGDATSREYDGDDDADVALGQGVSTFSLFLT